MRQARIREAAAANAALGADLYQVLAADAADTVFSPASVASALRMALCGARGQTAAELARALHLAGYAKPQDVAASGLRLMLARPGSGLSGPGGRPAAGPGTGPRRSGRRTPCGSSPGSRWALCSRPGWTAR